MSKTRIVDTRFWSDGYISSLTHEEKLLFVYLITNSKTELCGAYELPTGLIVYETGLSKEGVEKMLSKFQEDQKLVREGDWVLMVNFLKYQSLNPNIIKGILRTIEELPLTLRKKIKAFKAFQSLSKPFEPLPKDSTPELKLKLKPELKLEPEPEPIGRSGVFAPPTPEDVKAYCHERGNQVDHQRFWDFYASKGWMVGKTKMKDWKAAVRTWEKSDKLNSIRKTNVTII